MSGDMLPHVGEDDLHAWVDDQLPPERRKYVEHWLERNPEQSERFRAYRAQRARLRELLAPKAAEAIPDRLLPTKIAAMPSQSWHRQLRNVAAGIALLLAGAVGGWELRGPGTTPLQIQLAADALQAHLTFVTEVRHPVEVPSGQEAHLVSWLSNRLGRPLRVPDLSPFGFHLIGGRLLPSEADPAAQFMFEDDRAGRLTLYLRQESTDDTGFEIVQKDAVTGFRWFEGGFGYVVLAATGRDQLLQVAESIYRQLPGAAVSRAGH